MHSGFAIDCICYCLPHKRCSRAAPSSLDGRVRPQYLPSLRQHFEISLWGIWLTGELFTALLFHKTIVSKHWYPTALILDILLLPTFVTRLRPFRGKSEKICLSSAHLLSLPSCIEVFVNDFICFKFVRLRLSYQNKGKNVNFFFFKENPVFSAENLKSSNSILLSSPFECLISTGQHVLKPAVIVCLEYTENL